MKIENFEAVKKLMVKREGLQNLLEDLKSVNVVSCREAVASGIYPKLDIGLKFDDNKTLQALAKGFIEDVRRSIECEISDIEDKLKYL